MRSELRYFHFAQGYAAMRGARSVGTRPLLLGPARLGRTGRAAAWCGFWRLVWRLGRLAAGGWLLARLARLA